MALMLMRFAFIFAFTLLPITLFAGEQILEKGSKLECLHADNSAYGFLLERQQGDSIHASIITRNENEGAKSAFELEIASSDADDLILKYFVRQGESGTYRDFVIQKHRHAKLQNKLRARFTEINVTYRLDFHLGKELVEAGSEGSFELACELVQDP